MTRSSFVSVLASCLIALLGSVLLCGCASTWGEPAIVHPGEKNLAHIETIDLDRKSTTAPVTVAEATSRPSATRPAPSEIRLSLDDVRAAALMYSLDLQIERANPTLAQKDVDAEAAKFESTFVASAQFTRTDATGSQGQVYGAGIRAPLVTGGNARVAIPFDQNDTISSSYQSGLQFSLSQPLLRDAGFKANTDSIRILQYQKKIVDSQTKLQAIRILANADRAYWNVYSAHGELEINRQQYELAVRQVDQARKRFAAQASPRIEITRAESGAASRLEGIIVSETTVRQSERELKRIMNRPDLPVDSDTAIIPTTDPNPVGLVLSARSLSEHALENRMEMLQLELQLAQDASNIDFARNQALPLFVLDFDYNVLHSGNRAAQAFELYRGHNPSDWAVGLSAEIPIGNQAARSHLHRAILERVQRLSTKDLQQQSIVREVYDAVDQFDETWQRILAAKNESILAGRTYEAELRQFELGVRTSTDVLDAAARRGEAQSREVEALADYEISRVNIAFATGTLLGQCRIILPPPAQVSSQR